MATKPTPAQMRVLKNLAEGKEPFGHLRTQSEHGGAGATLFAIKRRKWIDQDFQLTDAGRTALAIGSA